MKFGNHVKENNYEKKFLIKTLSFTLFVSILVNSTIMPVNASALQGDVSENISIVNEETISSQTMEKMTDSKTQVEENVNNAEENTEKEEFATIGENTEALNTDETAIEEETTEMPVEDTNNTESEISPRWANPDHRDAQCNYVISQLGLNSNQASWLKEGATAPDSNYKKSKGFHAREALNTGGQTDNPSKVYADNPTFMPKRFNAAKQASVSFVQKAKNGKNFSGVDLFLDDYNLSLHKYSEYLPLI